MTLENFVDYPRRERRESVLELLHNCHGRYGLDHPKSLGIHVPSRSACINDRSAVGQVGLERVKYRETPIEWRDDTLEMEPPTVLVVDDDNAIRDALADALDQIGYKVVGARNGVEALEILYQGCLPSLVLLDLGMPKMDGWEFRQELLLDPRFTELPVVVITASRNERAEELQVASVLTKPLPLARLIDVLESHIRRDSTC